MAMIRCLKYLWAAPLTLFGVVPAMAVWLFHGHAHIRGGALEIHGPLADWVLRQPGLNFAAITIGHLIIARDAHCCAYAHAHEIEHVRQGERWGPLFPFAYCGAGLFLLLRGKRFYWDNPFERAARRADANEKARRAH